jgi:hypothetical protein
MNGAARRRAHDVSAGVRGRRADNPPTNPVAIPEKVSSDCQSQFGPMNSKSGPKRPSDKSEFKPKPGTAGPAKTIDPMHIADERAPDEVRRDVPRPAPAPGVPFSAEQFELLKRKAKTVRVPPSKHQQEDPSGKKKKKKT